MQYALQLVAVLAIGALETIKIAVVALAISLPVGLIVGAGRYSRVKYFRWPATGFVETFRNIPVLVSIMWFFFAFPMLVPFEISAYTAAVLALSLNTSAFFAEIFRAGIQSISPGQWDGARALGMSYRDQMQRIILPQAIRRMVPAFTNRWIELCKLTALASTWNQPHLRSRHAIVIARTLVCNGRLRLHLQLIQDCIGRLPNDVLGH